jgi:hypothetical protein
VTTETALETAAPNQAVHVAVWRKGFAVRTAALEPIEARAFDAAARGDRIASICGALSEGTELDAAAYASRIFTRWLARHWIARFDYESESECT